MSQTAPQLQRQRQCAVCGFDRRHSVSECCPECGNRDATACPTCRTPVQAWTFEDCPGCGRPLDCEADNDQPSPIGTLDEVCCECGSDLRTSATLRCPNCQALRLLRFDLDGIDAPIAERALSAHGLLLVCWYARGRRVELPSGSLWVRSNCWPSALWVLEAVGVIPAARSPVAAPSGA